MGNHVPPILLAFDLKAKDALEGIDLDLQCKNRLYQCKIITLIMLFL